MTICKPDHLTTRHDWTIQIPDLSGIQMVTLFESHHIFYQMLILIFRQISGQIPRPPEERPAPLLRPVRGGSVQRHPHQGERDTPRRALLTVLKKEPVRPEGLDLPGGVPPGRTVPGL